MLIYLIHISTYRNERERDVCMSCLFFIIGHFSLHVAPPRNMFFVPKTPSRGTCKCIMLLDLNISQFIGCVDEGALILCARKETSMPLYVPRFFSLCEEYCVELNLSRYVRKIERKIA